MVNGPAPSFDPSHGEGALTCPECGSPFLHHDHVEVYQRRGEDSEYGRHVEVNAEGVWFDELMDGNPSRRRHGIRIHFWCEQCGAGADDTTVALTLVQHKGNEHLRWEEING